MQDFIVIYNTLIFRPEVTEFILYGENMIIF